MISYHIFQQYPHLFVAKIKQYQAKDFKPKGYHQRQHVMNFTSYFFKKGRKDYNALETSFMLEANKDNPRITPKSSSIKFIKVGGI
jgi:hypothetical protein